MNKSRKKGIFLISVMALLIFIVLFASVVLITTQNAINMVRANYNDVVARNAAISGIEYARARIQQKWGPLGTGADPLWAGSDGSKDFSSYDQNFIITEHYVPESPIVPGNSKGWVEGVLKGNPEAKFFIFFQKPNVTTFDDPVVGQVTAKYRSVNNIDNFDSSIANYKFSGEYHRLVPPLTANIIVQGRYKNSEKILECMLMRLPDKRFLTMLSVGGALDVRLNNYNARWLLRPTLNINPEIDIKGTVNVVSPNSKDRKFIETINGAKVFAAGDIKFDSPYVDDNGKQLHPKDVSFFGNLEASGFSYNKPEIDRNEIINKMAPSSQKTINAGSYVFKTESDVNGSPVIKVYYYKSDGSLNGNQKDFIWGQDNGNDPDYRKLFDAIELQYDTNSMNIYSAKLKGSVEVEQARNFMGWVAASGLKFIFDSPDLIPFRIDKGNYIKNTVGGGVIIDAQIAGSGAIVADGDITIGGRNQFISTGEIYLHSGGNVSINPKIVQSYTLSVSYLDPETDTYMTEYIPCLSSGHIDQILTDIMYGDPRQYVAKALLAYLSDSDNFETDPETGAKLIKTSEEIYKSIRDTRIDVNLPNVDKYNGSLIRFLMNKYKYDLATINHHIDQLVLENSTSFGDYRKITDENLVNINKIDSGITGISRITANTEKVHWIKGIIYANGQFKATLGQDTLTLEGITVAGSMYTDSGNLNTIYRPATLNYLYTLGANNFVELFWASLNK
jgi:hypothetical protein